MEDEKLIRLHDVLSKLRPGGKKVSESDRRDSYRAERAVAVVEAVAAKGVHLTRYSRGDPLGLRLVPTVSMVTDSLYVNAVSVCLSVCV